MKTSELIRQIADELERVLDANAIPAPNAAAVLQIKALAARLALLDTFAGEKGGAILEDAQVFYGARQHYEAAGGADAIYGRMRHNWISRIRTVANRYAAAGI